MAYPAIKGLRAQYFGVIGGATATYWYVQAIYPGGRSPISGPVTLTIPAALTNDNKVLLNWDPAPGAIGYDILKNTTGTIPTGVATVAIGIAETANNFTDNGQTSASYTVVGGAGGGVVATATDTATLTTAQVVGQPAILTATPTAAAALTTPTATALLAAMQGAVANGSIYHLIIKNTSAGANTITLTAGTGVTISGTATIAQSTFREFYLIPTNTSTPAVTIVAIASGTF